MSASESYSTYRNFSCDLPIQLWPVQLTSHKVTTTVSTNAFWCPLVSMRTGLHPLTLSRILTESRPLPDAASFHPLDLRLALVLTLGLFHQCTRTMRERVPSPCCPSDRGPNQPLTRLWPGIRPQCTFRDPSQPLVWGLTSTASQPQPLTRGQSSLIPDSPFPAFDPKPHLCPRPSPSS